MSTPDPRLSRRDAERLLDAPAEHDSVLGWALTAASAPAHPEELRGEDAAVAAFHSARVSPAPAARTGYVSPSLGGRAATRAVIATGAVVALASGGFALASSADLPGVPGLPDLPTLPGQTLDQTSDRAPDQPTESVPEAPRGAAESATSSGNASADTSASATGSASAAPSGSTTPTGTPSDTPDQAPSPSPNLRGLCRAFQATDRTDAGRSLDSTAFLALATAAGGADRVATYCVDLIGPPKETGRPTDKPTPTTKPTPTPTPTTRPSPGRPTDKPSPAPGKPTDLPTPDGSGEPDKPDKPPKPDNPGKPGNPGSGDRNQTSG